MEHIISLLPTSIIFFSFLSPFTIDETSPQDRCPRIRALLHKMPIIVFNSPARMGEWRNRTQYLLLTLHFTKA